MYTAEMPQPLGFIPNIRDIARKEIEKQKALMALIKATNAQRSAATSQKPAASNTQTAQSKPPIPPSRAVANAIAALPASKPKPTTQPQVVASKPPAVKQVAPVEHDYAGLNQGGSTITSTMVPTTSVGPGPQVTEGPAPDPGYISNNVTTGQSQSGESPSTVVVTGNNKGAAETPLTGGSSSGGWGFAPTDMWAQTPTGFTGGKLSEDTERLLLWIGGSAFLIWLLKPQQKSRR